MTTETNPIAKWPTVICMFSLIYVSFFAALHARLPESEASFLPSILSLCICFLLVAGSIGVGLRRRWAVSLLLSGSLLVLGAAALSLRTIIVIMGGMPPPLNLLVFLIFWLPTVAWPVFLIVWFSRSSTKRAIQEQWIRP